MVPLNLTHLHCLQHSLNISSIYITCKLCKYKLPEEKNQAVPYDNCNFCQWHVRRQKHIRSGHVFTGSLEADDIILRDNATPQNPLVSRVLINAEGNS